jgi:hypothetical protein
MRLYLPFDVVLRVLKVLAVLKVLVLRVLAVLKVLVLRVLKVLVDCIS